MSLRLSRISISLINFYQRYLSFDTGILRVLTPNGACKFTPTCSEYTKRAILDHGLIQGSWMGLKRIWRCR